MDRREVEERIARIEAVVAQDVGRNIQALDEGIGLAFPSKGWKPVSSSTA